MNSVWALEWHEYANCSQILYQMHFFYEPPFRMIRWIPIFVKSSFHPIKFQNLSKRIYSIEFSQYSYEEICNFSFITYQILLIFSRMRYVSLFRDFSAETRLSCVRYSKRTTTLSLTCATRTYRDIIKWVQLHPEILRKAQL